MTLNTLEHRNVPQIHRVLERLVRFMTSLALAVSQAAEIDGVLNRNGLEGG